MEMIKTKQKKKKETKHKISKISTAPDEPIAAGSNIETKIQDALEDTSTPSEISKSSSISDTVIKSEKCETVSDSEIISSKSFELVDEPEEKISDLIDSENKENKIQIEVQEEHQSEMKPIEPLEQKISENTSSKTLQKSCVPPSIENILKSKQSDQKVLEIKIAKSVSQIDCVQHEDVIKPFTEQQLAAFHRNEELEIATTQFVQEFIETELKSNFEKKHYLYELLVKYIHSKAKLVATKSELNTYRKEITDLENKLWIVNETQVTERGKCRDGNLVSASQSFNVATFQQTTFDAVLESLNRIKDKLHADYSLYSHQTEVAKLQIEHYVQCIVSECQNQAKLTQNVPVHLAENVLPIPFMQQLRVSLSVLFSFQRRNISDKSVVSDIRKWIEKLVAILLRVASWRDHLFLLHHLLRCPAGISNWAAHFIQAPCSQFSISATPFSDPHIDHIVTLLATILLPIQQRDAFLSEFLVSLKEPKDIAAENMWVLVDSDGEDDEDVESGNKCPVRETDIVALINQIPLGMLFRNLIRVIKRDGQDVLMIEDITEHHILKLLAWSSCFIRLLGCGIQTYSTPRYRQLTKLLSRFVNYTIRYITELWVIFCCTPNAHHVRDEAMMKRLQVEYDALVIRATQCIYSSQRFGAWQFLAIMPFEAVSSQTLWMLYYMLHDTVGFDLLSSSVNKTEIQKKLSDISFRQNFEDKISELPEAEVYYLLQTFANMALARTYQDRDFIQFVTINLLHIGFISSSTHEHYSKPIRDLLTSLTVRYPDLISSILLSIQEHISQMGQLCLYLFKELPLHMWKPTEEDFDILSKELIYSPITSHENNLARLILAHLNWDFVSADSDDTMFLPYEIHLKTASLLVNATVKHYADGMIKGSDVAMIWETWIWKFVLRLRLHVLDRGSRMIYYYFNDPSAILRNIPENSNNLFSAVTDKQPLACFVSLLSTQWGHSVPLIRTHGFQLMQNLMNATRYNEVIIALYFIVPLFLSCEESLLKCEKFQEVIVALFNADKGYVKMAKNLIISDEPGPVIKQFGNMIQNHLNNYRKYNLNDPFKLITLWLKVITSIDGWNKDSNFTYIIDIILKHAFFNIHAINEVFKIFRDLLQKNETSKAQATGNSGITSIFSWVSSTTVFPTLLNATSRYYPWLAYFILDLEFTELEIRTGLWPELLIQLANSTGKTNIDNSLKKAAGIRKTPYFGSGSLSIYRWAQQALDTNIGHPILPLLWQKFFTLYLTRIPVATSGSDRGSVGNKFFDGVINLNFLKKIKKRLQESVEFYNTKAEEQPSRKEYFNECSSLFKTFSLWLEESRLHEPGLFLHALPPPYAPQKLLSIFEGNNDPWLEYVDYEQVTGNQKLSEDEWCSLCCRNQMPRVISPTKSPCARDDYLNNLIRRLNSYDTPQPPPPLPRIAPLIPPLPPNSLLNQNKLLSLVKPQVDNIIDFSNNYALRVSEHTALDCSYAEFLPQLYREVPRVVKKIIACKTGRSGQQKFVNCSGEATIILKCNESKINESVLHQIKSNRVEYENLIERCYRSIPQSLCIASVFVEHVTNVLQSEYVQARAQNDPNKIEIIQKVAVEYFYLLISYVTEEIKFYLPAKQLLLSCTGTLGKTFISSWDSETIRLVNVALQKQKLTDYLAPLLNPPVNGSSFLPAYKILVENVRTIPPDVLFIFIIKFDIEKWLTSKKPRLSERSELINTLLKALVSLGVKPEQQYNVIHKLFRDHLMLVFCHEWPEHYGEVLQAILSTSNTTESEGGGSISVLVWKDILNTLGYRNISGQSFTEELRHFATTQKLLKHEELLESAALFGHHFTQERLQYGLYGLYPRYRIYVEPITTLLAMLGHALVVSTINKYPGLLADKLCEMIWPALIDMFSPWLTPYWTKSLKDASANWIKQLTDGRAAVLPWIHADVSHAQKVITAFVNNIRFIMDMLPACNNVLNYVWQFYVSNFAHSAVKEHVLTPIHTALLILPWERFWPSIQDLEIMLKVADQYLTECHVFIGCITMRIPWIAWLEVVEKDETASSITIKAQQYLLPLLVKLAHEPAIQQQSSKQLQTILSQAFRFNWNQVDKETYEELINWYVMSGDPRAVLRIDDLKVVDHLILDLLQAAAEYIPSGIAGKLGIHAHSKRKIFIRGYIRLLTSTTSRYKQLLTTEDAKFRKAIHQALEDMENVLKNMPVNPGPDVLVEAKDLLVEFLPVVDDKNVTSLATDVIVDWISNRTDDSIVLRGVLCTLGRVPQCLIATGAILEAAILGYFNQSGANWQTLISLLDGRMLWTSKKLPSIMAQNGNILALHAIILLKENDRIISLNDLVEWIDKIKPNKSNESKLPLIWCDIIKLLVPLVIESQLKSDENTMSEIIVNIRKFISSLNKIADEKSGWGNSLLGAIGIKQNPTLITNRCRFLCRALAVYLKAQLLEKESFVNSIRCGGDGLENKALNLAGLDGLKSFAQGDMKICVDVAINQIQDPTNSLHNSNKFVETLCQQLYNQSYLKDIS